MPINPSFTGNRHLIPRDQLHELAKKVNARIQAEKSAPVQQRPPANTRATIPPIAATSPHVPKTDALYQSTVVGNRSDSARNIVSERTGVPPERLTYRSELGQELDRGIVGTGLVAGVALAAPQIAPYVLPVGKALATNVIGGAITDTAARSVFGDDAVDNFTYNYLPAISVGLGTLPGTGYAQAIKNVARHMADRATAAIMNTQAYKTAAINLEYPGYKHLPAGKDTYVVIPKATNHDPIPVVPAITGRKITYYRVMEQQLAKTMTDRIVAGMKLRGESLIATVNAYPYVPDGTGFRQNIGTKGQNEGLGFYSTIIDNPMPPAPIHYLSFLPSTQNPTLGINLIRTFGDMSYGGTRHLSKNAEINPSIAEDFGFINEYPKLSFQGHNIGGTYPRTYMANGRVINSFLTPSNHYNSWLGQEQYVINVHDDDSRYITKTPRASVQFKMVSKAIKDVFEKHPVLSSVYSPVKTPSGKDMYPHLDYYYPSDPYHLMFKPNTPLFKWNNGWGDHDGPRISRSAQAALGALHQKLKTTLKEAAAIPITTNGEQINYDNAIYDSRYENTNLVTEPSRTIKIGTLKMSDYGYSPERTVDAASRFEGLLPYGYEMSENNKIATIADAEGNTIPLVRPIIRELLTRSIVARDKKSILDASLRRLHSSINTTTTTKE